MKGSPCVCSLLWKMGRRWGKERSIYQVVREGWHSGCTQAQPGQAAIFPGQRSYSKYTFCVHAWWWTDSSGLWNPWPQHRYELAQWGGMPLSCSRKEWETILRSLSCSQPSLMRNGIDCSNRLGFSCNLAAGLHRNSLSLQTHSPPTVQAKC